MNAYARPKPESPWQAAIGPAISMLNAHKDNEQRNAAISDKEGHKSEAKWQRNNAKSYRLAIAELMRKK